MYLLPSIYGKGWGVGLLFFLLPISAYALRVQDFTFSHLGTLDGLSSQRIYSLHKTRDNAIWWTTKYGVDRANGTVVKNYPLGERNLYSSFAGRVVTFAHSTCNDDETYVFDNTGCIYHYNKIQDRFDLIANVSKIMNLPVMLNDILVTDECMWLAMREGIYKLFHKEDFKMKDMGIKYFCNYIQPYDQDKLLFCSHNGVYAQNGKKWSDDNVTCGYYDHKTNNLWLGTFTQGVKVVKNVGRKGKVESGKINTDSVIIPGIPHNPIRAITPYDNRTVLIGIDGFGVYQALRTASEVKPLFSANEGANGVLHGNGVYDITVDIWNNIVIASYSGGIDIARPVGSTTAIFRHIMNNPQSIINDHVNCVANWNDLLLMGTDDGISIYNTSTDSWRHTSRGMVVLDICKKLDGKLLIATYGNGVCEVSSDGSTRKLYSVADGTLRDDHVYRLSYDKAGNLWMGTLFGSLTVKTAEGSKYFNLDNILAFTPLSDGRMAIGSAHGLYFASVKDEKPQMVEYMPEGKADANRYVTDVFEDRDKKLWIATDGGGVYIYDLKTNKVTHQITNENGLPTNSVTSITKDQTGRIWLGTEKGLVFVTPDKPTDVINVSYCYGLNTEYAQHAVANLPNGDILYGTVDGAIIINPKNITRLNYQARLTIKGVRVHDNNDTGDESLDEFRQKIADGLLKGEIRLSYNERSFDILYESINLRNQYDVAYQYRMESTEWSQVITQQFLSFENLEPGKHTLHIRSISKTSGIVLDERTITIHIGQPWWNSWWMWGFYLLLLVLAFQGVWWMYSLHNKYLRLMREKVQGENPFTATPTPIISSLPVEGQESANHDLSPSGSLPTEENRSEGNEGHGEDREHHDEGMEFVGMATKLTLDNLKDTDFTIDNLCREMGMSRTLFYVKLKTYTGKSPQDFVRAIRLEKAASLLRQGRTVTEVSVLTGFDNPKYFSTVFKKYFGVSPSKYE